MEIQHKQFHSYVIKGVTNLNTDQTGWRIVGLWGEEEMGEGYRVGPYFKEDELEQCEALVDVLEELYGLPVKIETILEHFQIKRGDVVETPNGRAIVLAVAPQFNILCLLQGGQQLFRYEDCKKVLNTKSLPPNPQDFGFQDPNLYDEGGWMLEGGEEKYFEAYENWKKGILEQ